MIDTQPVKGTVDAQGALKRMMLTIDPSVLNKGDFVEFNAHGRIEVGIYIGTLAFRADTHEVWANGKESMMRIVHINKFIAHEPNKALEVHKMNCAIGYAGVGLDCICGAA